VKLNGWAMESRLYAEDPYRNFLPSIGPADPLPPAGRGPTDRRRHRAQRHRRLRGRRDQHVLRPDDRQALHLGADAGRGDRGDAAALDAFEVEGIGHNLPFLAAVMDHPRFVSGNITTAFIAEEYPEGFAGVTPDHATLRRLAAVAAHMKIGWQGRSAPRRSRARWTTTPAGSATTGS
jgi:propionyl-CoA carboxylase alpha chain